MPHSFWKPQFLTGLSDSCYPPVINFPHSCRDKLAEMQSPPVTPLPKTLLMFPIAIKIMIFKMHHDLDPAYFSSMPFNHLQFILCSLISQILKHISALGQGLGIQCEHGHLLSENLHLFASASWLLLAPKDSAQAQASRPQEAITICFTCTFLWYMTVYCTVCPQPKVKSSDVTIYLFPFTLYYSPPLSLW